MEEFNPTEFKLKGKVLKKVEAELLESHGYKWCPKCKEAKEKENFYDAGRGRPCISCESKRKKEKLRKFREKNPLPPLLTEEQKKENKRKAHREWFLLNKEKKNQQNKDWYYANKEKTKERVTKSRNKRKNQPKFKIERALRQRLRATVFGEYKSERALNLLGCSVEEFKLHLESLWTEGMSWENYGFYGWHIDHILPCSSFNLLDPEEQRKCFHWSNMQPLWANDNLRKSDKIIKNDLDEGGD